MQVVKITPQGYCHGVVKALSIATKAIKNPDLPRPIYILGQIVHNQHITNAFKAAGVITLDDKNKNRLELLDQIDTGTVIFTAHGVSPQVIAKAEAKKLTVIDAVCSDVKTTHQLIAAYIADGYDIFYIGKKGHPEPEGAIGINEAHIHLVETPADIAQYTKKVTTTKLLITNQTTLSIWDVAKTAEAIKAQFPTASYIKEICDATQVRQEAVIDYAPYVDVILVLGDPKSNNTNRLVQIAEESGVPAYRISDITALNPFWLKDKVAVGITSGASTPIKITTNAINFLKQFQYDDSTTWTHKEFFAPLGIIPQLNHVK
jgi:4-hydroxy-3-methylbut-2-enyl diphosphate reductase